MLDSIFNAVKGQVVNTITEKTGLGAEQAEQTFPLAKESVSEGLTSAVSGGNVDGILGMLQGAVGGSGGGGMMQNMVYQGIASNFIGKLTGKLGLAPGIASTVSGLALPAIMSKLGHATQEAGDSDGIDAGSLMGLLGGGGAAGMLGKAAGMLGGNDKQDGEDGGLLGKVGGMFK